jgi:hypothetical protein
MNDTSKLKITEVSYEEFTDIDFIPCSNYFVRSALGIYYFIHTSDRSKAQAWCDENFGKGKYKVIASKLQKPKGDLTVRGTHCRKGQKR